MIGLIIFIILLIFVCIKIERKYRWLHHRQWHVKDWLRKHLRRKRNYWLRDFLRDKLTFFWTRISR
jgi:hypothetical protein